MFDRNGNEINVGRCIIRLDNVTQRAHDEHNIIMDRLFANEVPGIENVLVHMTGADNEFDADGIPYVCDRHFIQAIAEALKDAA